MVPINKINSFFFALRNNANARRIRIAYSPLFLAIHINAIQKNNFIILFFEVVKFSSFKQYSSNNNKDMAKHAVNTES